MLTRHLFPLLRFNVEGAEGGGDQPTPTDGNQPPAYAAPASQADLDRIIEARLARERQKLVGEYGGDATSVKARLDDYQKHLDAQKTDHDRALDEAKTTATTEVTQRFLSKLVSSEVKGIASALGFNDPADALQVIDQAALPVKDDEPDTDAIRKAVEKLATEKPYLVQTGKPTPRTRPKPGQGEQTTDSTKEAGKGKAAAALRQLGASRKSS